MGGHIDMKEHQLSLRAILDFIASTPEQSQKRVIFSTSNFVQLSRQQNKLYHFYRTDDIDQDHTHSVASRWLFSRNQNVPNSSAKSNRPCWVRFDRVRRTHRDNGSEEKSNTEIIYEHIYKTLFELTQIQSDSDIVWGFGRVLVPGDEDNEKAFHFLEVRVEVELTENGSLLVMPCEHTGVTINREFVSSVSEFLDVDGCTDEAVSTLQEIVRKLDAKDIVPAKPSTYHHILNKAALSLSSQGSLVKYQEEGLRPPPDALFIDDSWKVFCRPKPVRRWARDARKMGEEVTNKNSIIAKATLSLTHGPQPFVTECSKESFLNAKAKQISKILAPLFFKGQCADSDKEGKFHFPLPVSNSQMKIANLLNDGASAVVVEGPPGSGKTHSIANIISAYLAKGLRVLVTSKGGSSLNVLRSRLPATIQDLCVDLSASESRGQQQLRQTVEKLSFLISQGVHIERYTELQNIHDEILLEISKIDENLQDIASKHQNVLNSNMGKELLQNMLILFEDAPWLVKTSSRWSEEESQSLFQSMKDLHRDEWDPIFSVKGIPSPPSDHLIEVVGRKAGYMWSSLSSSLKATVSCIPLVEKISSLKETIEKTDIEIAKIKIGDAPMQTVADWSILYQALDRERRLFHLATKVLKPYSERENWPSDIITSHDNSCSTVKDSFIEQLNMVVSMKRIASVLGITQFIGDLQFCRQLEMRRKNAVTRLQGISANIVYEKSISKLQNTFSPEAQSALIKFTQLAMKNDFNRMPEGKMSQRQHRHRMEYLSAFESAVSHVPCWIMNTAQVSEYLPTKCIFDLVIIDEASQSDISALPCMLRGKQWLVVGDSKQVSPTENFVREEHIERLRAALPSSPFQSCFLPGYSFFDLCNQAFPSTRVVLSEHFRCAPEIIDFCNTHFYSNSLNPLRVPTASERMNPSVVDIYVPGIKNGKENVAECETIVKMIAELVNNAARDKTSTTITIGVISLIGEEQSRLIRNRLLDEIGPDAFTAHKILVGDAPAFQGTERDVVFLSMVCSPGKVPTQNQLMHAQRINVAMSRARNRLVLVRSLSSLSQIPSRTDFKFAVMDFFGKHSSKNFKLSTNQSTNELKNDFCGVIENFAQFLGNHILKDYFIRDMSSVWPNGALIEDPQSGCRCAINIENFREGEWLKILNQQRALESVGWQCMRVSPISLLFDIDRTGKILKDFVSSCGIAEHVPHVIKDSSDVQEILAENFADRVESFNDRNDGSERSTTYISSDDETVDLKIDNVVSRNKYEVNHNLQDLSLEITSSCPNEIFGVPVDLEFEIMHGNDNQIIDNTDMSPETKRHSNDDRVLLSSKRQRQS